MPILDRLKYGVDVSKYKADQLLRINRVQNEIDLLNRDIAQIQKKITSKAIELHQIGNLANPELEQICLEIDEINRQIRDKLVLIASIRNEEPPKYFDPSTSQAANPCPKCGFDIPITAVFCPNCGHTVIREAPPSVGEATLTIPCPNCGKSIPANAVFCPECGQRTAKPVT